MTTYSQMMAAGNAHYAKDGEGEAKEAFKMYCRAESLATSPSDVASAHNNKCKAASRVCQTSAEGDVQKWYFTEALVSGSKALLVGASAGRGSDWMADMSDFIYSILQYAFENAASLAWGASLPIILLPLVQCTRHHIALRLPASIIILRLALRRAISAAATDPLSALPLLKRDESLVALCQEMAAIPFEGRIASSQKEQATDVVVDYRRSLNDAEAYRNLVNGRQAQEHILRDDAEAFEENTFHCIDTLRVAASYAAASGSLGYEAEAMCRIGHCIAKNLAHLFDASVALRYYQRGVHCAVSLGWNPSSTWFRDARDIVEADQQKRAKKETEEEQKRTAALMAEIKPELDALGKANTSLLALANYLRKAYMNETTDLKEVGKKLLLKKFIPFFRPDKAANDAPSRKLLFREISKALNAYYEPMKG